jgi:O-antigen/teichoic acid export membrane protein
MLIDSAKSVARKISYYFVALSGQASQSIFHFLLGLLLVMVLSPEGFGIFAIAQLLAFLNMKVSDAIVGIPLSVYRSQAKTGTEQKAYEYLFTSVNLLISTVGAVLIFGMVRMWLDNNSAAVLSALFVFTYTLRGFGRGISFARREPMYATRSDLVYVVVAVAILFSFKWYAEDYQVTSVLLSLSIANFVALAFLSPGFLRLQITCPWKANLSSYKKVWKEGSAWNLAEAASMELTANAHSYIIALFAGPQAFAPIAAVSVLFRPLNVIMGSLILLERPQLSEHIATNNKRGAHQTRAVFTSLLLLSWGLINLIVFLFWDHIFASLFAGKYLEDQVFGILVILSGIFLFRCVSALPRLEFQSRKKFQPLAMAAIYACPVSVIATSVLFFSKGVSASLLGIFLGDAVLLSLLLSLFLNVREPKPC